MLRKNGKKKWIIAAVALILVLLAGGLTAWKLLSSNESVAVKPTTKPTSLSAWVVDWQAQAGMAAVQKSPELVSQYEMDGIEIDYEQVPEQDWPGMLRFIQELQHKLSDAGKKLRIVLESQAPIEDLQFPEGPTYVMMAYNLYGTHSKAGPKADTAFITKIAKRMQYLPGDSIIALSVGGFA